MTLSDKLRLAASARNAEMRSRTNAIDEWRALLLEAARALDLPRNEQTSPEVASIAAQVLAPGFHPSELPLSDLKTMAGSLLTQAPDRTPVAPAPMTPEAERALNDAIRTNQAKPVISRMATIIGIDHGHPDGDKTAISRIPPNIPDEGNEA